MLTIPVEIARDSYDTISIIMQIVSILLLLINIILILKYVNATNTLVRKTADQARSSNRIAELSSKAYESVVSVEMNNKNKLAHYDYNGMIITKEGELLISTTISNICKALCKIQIEIGCITVVVDKTPYLLSAPNGVNNNMLFVIKPNEHLEYSPVINILHDDVNPYNELLHSISNIAFIEINYILIYDNEHDHINETWRYHIKKIQTNTVGDIFFDGYWAGPFRYIV